MGVLLGLACGDALGRPLEFRSTEWIADRHGTVREMLGQGTHGQPAGTVTDDTDLALCVARSLVEREDFDGQDVADRFREWFESGPFDVGAMTADEPGTLARVSRQSSAITHYDPRCTYGCAVLNCTIAGYLRGADAPLSAALERVRGDAPDALVGALRLVPDVVEEDQLEATGYVTAAATRTRSAP